MAFEFHWHLATSRQANRNRGEWAPDERHWAPLRDADSRNRQFNIYDYLAQVARAAEFTGFDGIVIPDDPHGEEPWILASALIRETRHVKLIATTEPGSASAVYRTKMASSAQRFSAGRLIFGIDLERDEKTRAREGDFLPQDAAAARAEEFLALGKGIWGEGPFDFEGEFFVVEQGGLAGLVTNAAYPGLWVRGGGEAGRKLAAEQDGTLVLQPQPIGQITGAVARLRAEGSGRIVAELPVLARALEADVAAELARGAPAPHTLTGTYDNVAGQIAALAEAGLDGVILSAPDQIHEVHIAGEQIVSRVRRHLDAAARAA